MSLFLSPPGLLPVLTVLMLKCRAGRCRGGQMGHRKFSYDSSHGRADRINAGSFAYWVTVRCHVGSRKSDLYTKNRDQGHTKWRLRRKIPSVRNPSSLAGRVTHPGKYSRIGYLARTCRRVTVQKADTARSEATRPRGLPGTPIDLKTER